MNSSIFYYAMKSLGIKTYLTFKSDVIDEDNTGKIYINMLAYNFLLVNDGKCLMRYG